MPFTDYLFNYTIISSEKCENIDRPAIECYGKCYLKKELASAAEKDNTEESQTGKTKVRLIEVHGSKVFHFDLSHVENMVELTGHTYIERQYLVNPTKEIIPPRE